MQNMLNLDKEVQKPSEWTRSAGTRSEPLLALAMTKASLNGRVPRERGLNQAETFHALHSLNGRVPRERGLKLSKPTTKIWLSEWTRSAGTRSETIPERLQLLHAEWTRSA